MNILSSSYKMNTLIYIILQSTKCLPTFKDCELYNGGEGGWVETVGFKQGNSGISLSRQGRTYTCKASKTGFLRQSPPDTWFPQQWAVGSTSCVSAKSFSFGFRFTFRDQIKGEKFDQHSRTANLLFLSAGKIK